MGSITSENRGMGGKSYPLQKNSITNPFFLDGFPNTLSEGDANYIDPSVAWSVYSGASSLHCDGVHVTGKSAGLPAGRQ